MFKICSCCLKTLTPYFFINKYLMKNTLNFDKECTPSLVASYPIKYQNPHYLDFRFLYPKLFRKIKTNGCNRIIIDYKKLITYLCFSFHFYNYSYIDICLITLIYQVSYNSEDLESFRKFGKISFLKIICNVQHVI